MPTAPARPIYVKDPQSKVDFPVSWASWLAAGDAIASVVWSVPSGLTKESQSNTADTATVWLSSGVSGAYYEVECKITTNLGRIETQTIIVKCEDR